MTALLTRHFQNSPQEAASALHDCIQFIAQHSQHVADIEIALAEAINNVVDHAYSGAGHGTVEIRAGVDIGVHCTVRDKGRGFAHAMPLSMQRDEVAERGYGFPLMRTLAADVTISSGGVGTDLTLSFPP